MATINLTWIGSFPRELFRPRAIALWMETSALLGVIVKVFPSARENLIPAFRASAD
jgi:hypothetical protein